VNKFNIIYVIIFICAYFIGAIPWAYLIGKINGMDIRKHGSGNVGATNVRRVLGKKLGVLCFVLDFLKGFMPAFLILRINSCCDVNFSLDIAFIVTAFALVSGHMWPVYLKFKGGKGVSTMAGILLALAPLSLLLGGGVWAMVFYSSRFVSLASILAALSLPVSAYLLSVNNIYSLSQTMLTLLSLLALLVIYRHKGNIIRLFNGTENRFTKKKKVQSNENCCIK